jgi:RNA polymerase sigma-70 factor (ECF subfamily)
MRSDGKVAGAESVAGVQRSRRDEDRSRARLERTREEELIRQCLDGDTESFRPLVDRYSPSLHSFVVRYVGNRDEARDIVQEAFLRAYRALADFDRRYRFSTWLYRIALNLCRDHHKRHGRGHVLLGFDQYIEDEPLDDPIEQRVDDRRRCEAALVLARSLPAKYRDPLLLKDVERMDYKRMSRVTGLSVGLLKIRVMRARRKLAGVMQHHGLAPGNDDEPTG